MADCTHVPFITIAQNTLLREGRLSAYEAAYEWSCPKCGQRRRTTRIATAIHTLRREGMDIETVRDANRLATYVYHPSSKRLQR